MTVDAAQLKTDRAAMIADWNVEITFGANKVYGVKSVLVETEVAASAGALKGYKMSLHCVTADWTTAPNTAAPGDGDLITVAGVEYRILRVNPDVVGTRFDVGEKYTPRAT